jgi:hypothetical protein
MLPDAALQHQPVNLLLAVAAATNREARNRASTTEVLM